jgi:hypothetical protein
MGLPPKAAPAWRHLEAMFSLTYFERIWIIQEVQAARSATFLWGNVEITWDDIESACLFASWNSFYVSDGIGLGEAQLSLPAMQLDALFAPYDRSYT